jgi:hypothetical protein
MPHPRCRENVARAIVRSSLGSMCLALSLGACNGNSLASSAPSPDAGAAAISSSDAAPAPSDLALAGRPQAIGNDGLISGDFSGYAWVAGGAGTTWLSPNPCSEQGCFLDTGGILCAQGSIAALTCSSPSACDWDVDWGAMIGWNPTATQHQAWGGAAASAMAVTFTGVPGEYRLMAHVAGDPDSKVYCVEDYPSGRAVVPSDFLSECWSNAGDALPDFGAADVFGLQLIAAPDPIDFEFCVSAITLF